MIAQESIEEVKDRANLVELIGESVSLKRQGSSFVGCCPFHQEKTGSFHIRDGGKFYHCFGCGASGNAISYYMQTKGVSFPQAVEELAERFGIVLKFTGKQKEDGPKENKNIFFDANTAATSFFMHSLNEAPAVVKDYVKKRNLLPDTIKAFSIGFSPVAWRALSDVLKKKNIPEEVILNGGLARRNQKGELYDFFRARLIFPIFSDNKKVAAFGGRLIPGLIDDEHSAQMPKYLNSSDSPVYQKNKTLFGLPQAMAAIRKEGVVYIVEGYMDVVSLWQAGVKNVVATCGTALTSGHVKRLSFLAKRVLILFDGDNAGRTAASKAFSTFMNSGLDARILFLPEEDDPDSIASRMGDQTAKFLSELPTHSLLDCHIESILSRFAVKNVKDLGAALKGQVCQEVATLLSSVKNAVEKSELINEAAFKLMVGRELLQATANTNKTETQSMDLQDEQPSQESQGLTIKPLTELSRLDQEILLSIMALKEELADKVLSDPDVATVLDPVTIAFAQSLSRLMSDEGLSKDDKKEQIKILLKDFGSGWMAHWKKAHDMSQDIRVDLRQNFNQCLQRVQKNKLNQSLRELDNFLQITADEDLKIELAQRRVGLIRQINSILVLPEG